LIDAAVVSEPTTLPLVTERENALGIMSNTTMLMSLMSGVSEPGAPRLMVLGQPRYRSCLAISLTGSVSLTSYWPLKATFTWKRVDKSPPSRGHTQLYYAPRSSHSSKLSHPPGRYS
jgi:hypothetical protein